MTRNPQARLRDVAARAGVTAQTVSNVLNDKGRFSPATRQRVLAAAADLGYAPNRLALNLRTRRSGQIALHIPRDQLGIRDSFTYSFILAMIDEAESHGLQVVVLTHQLDEQVATAAGVDGFVLCNNDPADGRADILYSLGIPFVLFGQLGAALPATWVDIDNAAAMGPVVEHLAGRGVRTIGFLGYDDPQYWNRDRFRGVVEASAAQGILLPEKWCLSGDFDSLQLEVGRLLTADRPEAIVCTSDSLAMMAHIAASSRGLRPGTDVLITGFDALPLAVALDPPLTSVALPIQRVSTALIELLLSLIAGDPAPPVATIIPTSLSLGGTA